MSKNWAIMTTDDEKFGKKHHLSRDLWISFGFLASEVVELGPPTRTEKTSRFEASLSVAFRI